MPFKLAFFVSFCCLFWTLTNAVIYEGGIAIDDGPETDPDGSMKKYIVVFKEGVSDDAVETHFTDLQSYTNQVRLAETSLLTITPTITDLQIIYKYNIIGKRRAQTQTTAAHRNEFKAYAAFLLPSMVQDFHSIRPEVDYIEESYISTIDAPLPPGGVQIDGPATMYVEDTQTNPPWHLARVWQHKNVDHSRFVYDANAGYNVDVYVIDTGVNIDHDEFQGRASWGASFGNFGNQTFDGNGHGTHVSGLVAGKTFGVAKGSKIIGIKVLSDAGSGSNADIIRGIDFAVDEATRKQKRGIVNMSLGGRKSRAINDAVSSATSAGLLFVVAAGNTASDACTRSPASSPLAITVGATNATDYVAFFSNQGTCVDIFAPGQNLISSWKTGKNATRAISGTSMASPVVAGVAALALAKYPDLSPEELAEKLVSVATRDVLKGVNNNTANLLVYSRFTQSKKMISL